MASAMFLIPWLLLFLCVLEKPIGATSDPPCFFAEPRLHELETCPRETFAAVTGTCEGTKSRLSDLQKISVSEYGAFNQLELALARGAGIFADATFAFAKKWADKFICRKHYDELVRKWSNLNYHHMRTTHTTQGKKVSCGIPNHARPVILSRSPHHLTKTMAQNYLVNHHQLLPIGLAICDAHDELKKPTEVEAEDASEKKDKTWKEEPKEETGSSTVPLETLKAFDVLVDSAGITRGACPSKNFRTFLKDTKQRRVYALRKLTDLMISILAPGAETELKESFAHSFTPRSWKDSAETKLNKVIWEVVDQYEKYSDRRSKEIVLSVLADVLPYRELQEFIPGVSVRKYYNAKRRAISREDVKERKIQKTRYEPVRVGYFVSFITSGFVSIGMPSGERTVRTSTGAIERIPNTLRLYRNAEIWRMFSKYMQDSNKSGKMISESVAHGILQKCSATRRHVLTCIDYFVSMGLEAFEDLDDMLDTLVNNALLDRDMHKVIKHSLLRTKTYLRTDYKVHCKKESRVADHAMLYALSDPSNKQFRYTGTTSVSLACPRCRQLHSSIQEMESIIDGVLATLPAKHGMRREVSEMKIRLENNVEKILELKKHYLRSVYTNEERNWIINSLAEGEGLATMDFSQKILPMYKWEDQQKYFGKRGMSVHIFHVLLKLHGNYIQHSFVHVLEPTKQDSFAVVQIIDHVMKKLIVMGVKAIHLRADNAGAYHSLSTINSLPDLVRKHKDKIAVKSFSFSEAQNGKSSCDRVSAQVKRRIRDYVAARNTVANEEQLFTAIAQSGLQGVSVYLARINSGTEKEREEQKERVSPKIANIGELGYFQYGNGTVKCWRYYGIGAGADYSNLHGLTREIEELKEGGMYATKKCKEEDEKLLKNNENPKHFWLAYLKKVANEEPDDISTIDPKTGDEIPEGNGGLFMCSECGSSYIKFGNLQRHVEIGAHHVRPEHVTLYDYALKLYKEGLEDVVKKGALLDEVNEAITDMSKDDGEGILEEGWALRGKRKTAHYSAKAKKFVEEKFNEGFTTNRKMDSAEAERLMKEDETIKPGERMNAQQIKSYFSQLCRLRKTQTASRAFRYKRSEEEDHCDDELSEEEVENIDDFGREVADIVDDIVWESRNELFDNPGEPFLEMDD